MSDISVDIRAEHKRLSRLAYRMLGGWADAEDMAQDALMRLSAQSPTPDNPQAWLTTVTTRLCIDRLRRNKARRETYPGPWLPDPIATETDEPTGDLSLGFLLMLERLSPEERAAFTLREAFGTPYAEIAGMLDKSEIAVRQIVSRARQRIQVTAARAPVRPSRQLELMQAFLAATLSGDTARIKSVLCDDVRMLTDGGGRRAAALRPVIGKDDVAQLVHFLAGRRAVVREAKIVTLNGASAFWFVNGDGEPGTLQIEAEANGIIAIYSMRNPEKLGHLFRANAQLA